MSDRQLATLAGLLAAATSYRGLGRTVECHFASSDAKWPFTLAVNLAHVHREVDIEFGAVLLGLADIVMQRLGVHDVVHSWPTAGTKEPVLEVFADDDVVDADFREQEHAAGDFRVAKQCRSSHSVVPISVHAFEWQDGGEAAGIEPFHRNAGPPGVGQPDQ